MCYDCAVKSLECELVSGLSECGFFIHEGVVNHPALKGAELVKARLTRLSANTVLRLQQVVKTYQQMLPKFTALKGSDHAGER